MKNYGWKHKIYKTYGILDDDLSCCFHTCLGPYASQRHSSEKLGISWEIHHWLSLNLLQNEYVSGTIYSFWWIVWTYRRMVRTMLRIPYQTRNQPSCHLVAAARQLPRAMDLCHMHREAKPRAPSKTTPGWVWHMQSSGFVGPSSVSSCAVVAVLKVGSPRLRYGFENPEMVKICWNP